MALAVIGSISVSPRLFSVDRRRDGGGIRPASAGAVKRLRRGETPPPAQTRVL